MVHCGLAVKKHLKFNIKDDICCCLKLYINDYSYFYDWNNDLINISLIKITKNKNLTCIELMQIMSLF
jgi:hypothetical protein